MKRPQPPGMAALCWSYRDQLYALADELALGADPVLAADAILTMAMRIPASVRAAQRREDERQRKP